MNGAIIVSQTCLHAERMLRDLLADAEALLEHEPLAGHNRPEAWLAEQRAVAKYLILNILSEYFSKEKSQTKDLLDKLGLLRAALDVPAGQRQIIHEGVIASLQAKRANAAQSLDKKILAAVLKQEHNISDDQLTDIFKSATTTRAPALTIEVVPNAK